MKYLKPPCHPYTIKLLASVPSLNMSRNEPLHSIDGTPPDLYIPLKASSSMIDVKMP